MDNQLTTTKSITEQIIDETLHEVEKSTFFDEKATKALRMLAEKGKFTDKKSVTEVLQNKDL